MDLENKLEECPKHYKKLKRTFANVLDAHTLRKTKVLRGNQKPHDDKNLRKDIMHYALAIRKANKTQILR